MLVVMKNTATDLEIQAVCDRIRQLKLEAHPMPGAQRTAICITGNVGVVPPEHFISCPGVHEVISVSKPYKLVSRETKPDNTVITVGEEKIGEGITMIAGPCSVEHEESTLRIAELIRKVGITCFRAGAYKPRTGPYSFQGLGEEGLEILAKVKTKLGMSIVTEVMDVETTDRIADVADILQVGTRNMSNTSLLKKLGKQSKPVLLKRGMSATLDEYLQAAEYIMAGGNYNVILCERGIRTFNDHCRNTLDVAIIPALQQLSHLPVLADPSHAAGAAYLVIPLARAAIAAGAQGLLVEAHDNPAEAYSDGHQALLPDQLIKLMHESKVIQQTLIA